MNVLETQIWIRIRRGTIRSRAEAARFFGVSRPTASLAAERLIEAGLLKETGRGISSGGRAPTPRKDRLASDMMASGMSRVKMTISVGMQFGRM